MTDNPPASATAAFLRDCHTIWLSELQALAVDRELIEAWGRWVEMHWPRTAPCPMERVDGAAAVPRPDAQTWAAASGAAPDPRDVAFRSLERRIADLERGLDAAANEPGSAA